MRKDIANPIQIGRIALHGYIGAFIIVVVLVFLPLTLIIATFFKVLGIGTILEGTSQQYKALKELRRYYKWVIYQEERDRSLFEREYNQALETSGVDAASQTASLYKRLEKERKEKLKSLIKKCEDAGVEELRINMVL